MVKKKLIIKVSQVTIDRSNFRTCTFTKYSLRALTNGSVYKVVLSLFRTLHVQIESRKIIVPYSTVTTGTYTDEIFSSALFTCIEIPQ